LLGAEKPIIFTILDTIQYYHITLEKCVNLKYNKFFHEKCIVSHVNGGTGLFL